MIKKPILIILGIITISIPCRSQLDTSRVFAPSIEKSEREITIANIKVTHNDSQLTRQIESLLDLRRQGSVTETIKFNIEQILDYLENHGYPFGQVSLDSIALDSGNEATKAHVICYLGLEPGPQVTIDTVIVQGNNVTRRQVVVRETRLRMKENYEQNQVAKVPARLMRTGLFSQVSEPEIVLDSLGRGYLIVRVKEGNTNQLNAVLGYNPSSNNREKGYVTGSIDVSFKNLLGTRRALEAFWQKKDRRSQELRIRYFEPWIAGYPVNIAGSFQQMIQDTTFLKRNLMLEIEFPFSDLLSIQCHIGTEDVLPDSMGQILYQLPQSQSWFSRLGFIYDARDDLWNPTRGIRYQTQFEYAWKKLKQSPFVKESNPKGNFRRDRWLMDFELYIPTFRWQTIFLGLHGRQVKSNEDYISISDLYRFGGTTSLRGFREEEFWGERIAWANCEYRYLLASRSRVFLFVDAGYFYRKNAEEKIIKDYKLGYGLGVRIETRLGVIGVDYGLGKGRGLTSGLVHVGLTNQF